MKLDNYKITFNLVIKILKSTYYSKIMFWKIKQTLMTVLAMYIFFSFNYILFNQNIIFYENLIEQIIENISKLNIGSSSLKELFLFVNVKETLLNYCIKCCRIRLTYCDVFVPN